MMIYSLSAHVTSTFAKPVERIAETQYDRGETRFKTARLV